MSIGPLLDPTVRRKRATEPTPKIFPMFDSITCSLWLSMNLAHSSVFLFHLSTVHASRSWKVDSVVSARRASASALWRGALNSTSILFAIMTTHTFALNQMCMLYTFKFWARRTLSKSLRLCPFISYLGSSEAWLASRLPRANSSSWRQHHGRCSIGCLP